MNVEAVRALAAVYEAHGLNFTPRGRPSLTLPAGLDDGEAEIGLLYGVRRPPAAVGLGKERSKCGCDFQSANT